MLYLNSDNCIIFYIRGIPATLSGQTDLATPEHKSNPSQSYYYFPSRKVIRA